MLFTYNEVVVEAVNVLDTMDPVLALIGAPASTPFEVSHANTSEERVFQSNIALTHLYYVKSTDYQAYGLGHDTDLPVLRR